MDRLQHRRLDLEVVVRGERRAQARDGGRAGAHRDARLLARDEVEVALAHPGLVAELGVQVRQRQERPSPRSASPSTRMLSSPRRRRDDLAADEHVVAEVDELLPALERLLADLGERHHHLDAGCRRRPAAPRSRACRCCGECTTRPASPTVDAGGGVRLEVAPLRAHLGDGVRDRHRHRVGRRRRSAISRSRFASRTAFCSAMSLRR